ncbi:MAG: PaaI family thioesterase [Leptospiraceae bacterium]|nr:PaaI family thioesterase [Leptospiraceae bacterium]MDW7974984.1 PaaI family thioesterase [Leptospiraceae bacterium]
MDSVKTIFDVSPSKVGQDWHDSFCFGCGTENPFSLRASFLFDEEFGEVHFDYVIRKEYGGAPNYAHGGILATLLDEAQGCLCFHVGHVVMTESLHIKYHKAVPLNVPIRIRAWLTAVRKRRLYTRGIIYIPNKETQEQEIYVSSNASWYVLPEKLQRKMFLSYFSEEEIEKQKRILELNRKRAREIRLRLRKNRHSV